MLLEIRDDGHGFILSDRLTVILQEFRKLTDYVFEASDTVFCNVTGDLHASDRHRNVEVDFTQVYLRNVGLDIKPICEGINRTSEMVTV